MQCRKVGTIFFWNLTANVLSSDLLSFVLFYFGIVFSPAAKGMSETEKAGFRGFIEN